MSAPIRTVCLGCGMLVHNGPLGPGGAVSHGLCRACVQEKRAEFGLAPLAEAELAAYGLAPAAAVALPPERRRP
jgi:hypothetical protein